MTANHFQIRDPIHGVIFISHNERAVIDSAPFQRLRHIKQVGFADFAFPCATHSRYSHSLGAMFLASRIFDRVIASDQMATCDRNRMRQTVRLAALLHDIGHPPLSHTTEMMLPTTSSWKSQASGNVRATHEDFTLRILLDSPLTKIIEDSFSELEISASTVASLLCGSHDDDFFRSGGKDFSPILRQIISSEIDADRMDYLLRDSFFCGVNYGNFDLDWLIENLVGIEFKDNLFLGLKARAIFAFEDFLLSRYHMFLSVYFHHTPVIMEKMLRRFFEECPQAFTLPADINEYLSLNDLDLWQALRKSDNPWAQRIVQRRPYVMLDEQVLSSANVVDGQKLHHDMIEALHKANIDVMTSQSKSVLSNYVGKIKSPLFVEDLQKRAVLLEEYSQLFVRYQIPAEIYRIFVDGKDKEKAERIIHEMG